MGRFERTWEGDWQNRIYQRVHGRNFSSLTDFAAGRPRDTLIELAAALGEDVAAIQIETLLRAEAEKAKSMGAFARHLLVRSLRDELRNGWGTDVFEDGQRFEALFLAAGAWAALATGLPKRDKDAAELVWQRLKNMDIPIGWLPEGPDDPFIVQAFEGIVFPSDGGRTQPGAAKSTAMAGDARAAMDKKPNVDQGDDAQEAGYWRVLGPYWGTIDIYDDPDEFLATWAAVPTVPRTLYAAHFCQSEVCNGGLHQFFSNPTGVLAPEAVAAYRRIGLEPLAKVLEQAMGFFGPRYPRSRDRRCARLDKRARQGGAERDSWDPFVKLDARFYAALGEDHATYQQAMDAYAKTAEPPAPSSPLRRGSPMVTLTREQ